MTLLYAHDLRLRGPVRATRFTFARAIRRIGVAFKAIHRAIAAAKIHRLRNELLLHRGHEDWAQMNLDVGSRGADAAKYPQRPVVLGEKWDY
ncbi:hypothetical protein [Bradyrhizobium genosp. P]|uniref:hypothetical protein n=1 Tax=Bradyrhizobium genosp. P TaxID=83641 RepID=UPI003CF91D87